MDRKVYVDHSATTYVKPEVLDEMLPYFKDEFGNASSIYSLGRQSKAAVEAAREQVADAIHAKPHEIFFTGSGSEADNWAIKGVCEALKAKGNHIITSKIEHPAVLNTCKHLEKQGYEITYVDVDENGFIKLSDLENAIKETTVLITVMFANNEIGTIQPIAEIGEIAKKHGILFHTDAVQAVCQVPIDVSKLNVDLLTMSAHKFYGPKGIGALYIKTGTRIAALIDGGAQERGKRASTENVPAIVGMGKAAQLACVNLEEKANKLASLRNALLGRIKDEIRYIKVNGSMENRLPGSLNVSFEFIEGESLLMMLDMKGIYASTGSACSSGSLDPSHVLLAIGLPHEMAHGSLRISFGDENTMEDVDYIMEHLPKIVARLRAMSPLYEEVERGVKHV